MANVYAVKSGNWSDTTLWNTGNLPAVIDDVYSNNFTVYVDISPQVSSVRNLSATSITSGGSFILNDGISLSANVIGGGVDNVFCVRFLSAAPAFANITGNVSTSGSLVNVRQSFALELSGTGTLTVYGSAINGNNNGSGTGVSNGYIQINAPGVLNIFGDVQGSLNGNVYWGIYNGTAGTVNVVGNIIGRTTSAGGVTLHVIRNNSTGTINVTGNVQAGVDNANIGIFNNSTGVVNVRGNVTGGLGSVANIGARGIFNNAAGTVNIIGDVAGGQQGHEGLYNNASTSVANITGTVYGGYIPIAGTIPGLSVGIVNGGVLNVLGGVIGGAGNSSYGIIHAGNTPTSTTIYGNVSGFGGNSSGARNSATGTINIIGNTYGGQGTSTPGTWNASTGTINLTGNCYGYGYIPNNLNFAVNGTGGYGIHNVAGGVVNVRGNVYSSNRRGDAWGIYNQGSGSVTVFGNAYGGPAPAQGADGIRNLSTSTGTIILSGTAYGGNGLATAYGVNNLSTTAIVRVKRAVGNDWGLGYTTALSPNPGVFGSQTGSTFVEELECGPRGQWPTAGNIYFTPNSKATSMFETDTFQNYTLIQSNSADNLVPPVSSVRQGEVYNLGSNTGTCIIPPVSSVAADTLVDNLTGTAVLTPQDTWNYPTTASDVNSMGGRLRNALNTNSANSLINSFNP
jgi:hypothetical protein